MSKYINVAQKGLGIGLAGKTGEVFSVQDAANQGALVGRLDFGVVGKDILSVHVEKPYKAYVGNDTEGFFVDNDGIWFVIGGEVYSIPVRLMVRHPDKESALGD